MLDQYENKEINKIERKIFKGIFEKKLSEDEGFSDHEEVSKNKQEIMHSRTTYRKELTYPENTNYDYNLNSKNELDSKSKINDFFEQEYDYKVKFPQFNYNSKYIIVEVNLAIWLNFI